jgi:RNA polymerase sigma factor (sigma-70 family)
MIVMRMNVSDEILASQAANGDAAAFSSLLARHYDGLFRLTLRLTGARAEAEDLTQDICAALPIKLAGFRGEARFTTWLWRVAVNAVHDRRRRAATRARNADGWGDWEVNRRAVNAEAAEAVDWLTEAMRALPADLRDTLALVLDDATHAQAGEVLQVSAGTISWRVSEAKKMLRAMRELEDQP